MDQDQRHFDRVEIPDGNINILLGQGKLPFFPIYSRDYPLRNLTKCGLCFMSDKAHELGEVIELRLRTPHTRPVKLKIKILWNHPEPGTGRFMTGARILPFGSMSGLNSPRSLQKIKDLERIYSHMN